MHLFKDRLAQKSSSSQVVLLAGPEGQGNGSSTAGDGQKLGPDYYKESHAKSHNSDFSFNSVKQLCHGRVCLWAKCQKAIKELCPAYKWATTEYTRRRAEGLYQPPVPVAPVDSRSEYREFLRELGKQGTYVSFGNEAENCGRWGMLKRCEHGHEIVKRLFDGREWCPVCGADDSEHHRRRISRLVDRVFCLDSVGYLVFEVPLILRPYFEDIGLLAEASVYIGRMLRREGLGRGVRRWHFYGSPAVKEDGALDMGKYHPHLNVLVERGYIGKKVLRRIRRLWSNWLKQACTQDLYRTAPVHYEYCRAPSRKWHWLRYITRSTFKVLTDENRHIASDLFQFHNTSWFGKFTDEDKAIGRSRFEAWLTTLPPAVRHNTVEVAAHEAYESGLCPVCGAPTELVEGVVEVTKYDIVTDYGGGLYHIRSPSSYGDLESLLGKGCMLL